MLFTAGFLAQSESGARPVRPRSPHDEMVAMRKWIRILIIIFILLCRAHHHLLQTPRSACTRFSGLCQSRSSPLPSILVTLILVELRRRWLRRCRCRRRRLRLDSASTPPRTTSSYLITLLAQRLDAGCSNDDALQLRLHLRHPFTLPLTTSRRYLDDGYGISASPSPRLAVDSCTAHQRWETSKRRLYCRARRTAERNAKSKELRGGWERERRRSCAG